MHALKYSGSLHKDNCVCAHTHAGTCAPTELKGADDNLTAGDLVNVAIELQNNCQ